VGAGNLNAPLEAEMTAMGIFMGLCMLGMLVLLRCLFAWCKESAVGGSFLLKLGERRTVPSESHAIAAAAVRHGSAHAA
jgi:hypothetical protein